MVQLIRIFVYNLNGLNGSGFVHGKWYELIWIIAIGLNWSGFFMASGLNWSGLFYIANGLNWSGLYTENDIIGSGFYMVNGLNWSGF